MLTESLLEAQRDLEQRSQAEGYARFLKQQETVTRHEGAYATREATKVIQGCIPLVAEQVRQWVASADNGGKGRTHAALATLKRFDPESLAFIALNQLFVGVTSNFTVAKVQAHIGTVLEGEVEAQELEVRRDKATAERVRSLMSRQGSKRNRNKAFNSMVARLIPEREKWANEVKVKVGEPLVNAVLLALPELFELVTLSKGRGNMSVVVRLTNAGVELLASVRESIAWNNPIHRPMVVEPRPWEAFDTGCYYDERAARNVKLVRTYNADHRRLIKRAIKDGSMVFVLEAVNAIQATPWAINRPLLEALGWAWEAGSEIRGFGSRKLVNLPQRLPDAIYGGMSDREKKGHRITIAGIREKNRAIVADIAVMHRDLETAKELAAYDRFYLPHNLDFRGRVYPVCHFSHQRADPIKALFRFADGCPVGDHGGAWLGVHLANCGDFQKVSKRAFADRLQWVDDNEELILSIADDPRATVSSWGVADKPFQFLAACIEWAGYVRSGRSEEFVSYLPIALDGSNSGLQHYSAALRAEDEAALVSLTPSETPADLYQTVADDVVAKVTAEAAEGNVMARLALEVGVDRSLVKRNVMTFAYSSEQYGFRQQLIEDTMRPLVDEMLTGKRNRHPWALEREDGTMDDGFAMTGYLAGHIYRAVTRTVTKATKGMAFFKEVAAILAHHKKPLVFTSPVGLPVVHRYSEWETKAVKLFLYDRRVAVTDAGPSDKIDEEGRVLRQVRANIRTKPSEKIDKTKARSAVAPNVIHAMDGAHLMLTVLDAKDAGITSLALIHDSFATHAGRTAEFFGIIRQAFVNMYENYCPFAEVLKAAQDSLVTETATGLPNVPEKGSLDLRLVLDADYAFA